MDYPKNSAIEFRIKRVPKMIVALWRIFSGPRFVFSHIPPLMLVRLSATFLFCISITKVSKIQIITSVICKACIDYFLINKNE